MKNLLVIFGLLIVSAGIASADTPPDRDSNGQVERRSADLQKFFSFRESTIAILPNGSATGSYRVAPYGKLTKFNSNYNAENKKIIEGYNIPQPTTQYKNTALVPQGGLQGFQDPMNSAPLASVVASGLRGALTSTLATFRMIEPAPGAAIADSMMIAGQATQLNQQALMVMKSNAELSGNQMDKANAQATLNRAAKNGGTFNGTTGALNEGALLGVTQPGQTNNLPTNISDDPNLAAGTLTGGVTEGQTSVLLSDYVRSKFLQIPEGETPENIELRNLYAGMTTDFKTFFGDYKLSSIYTPQSGKVRTDTDLLMAPDDNYKALTEELYRFEGETWQTLMGFMGEVCKDHYRDRNTKMFSSNWAPLGVNGADIPYDEITERDGTTNNNNPQNAGGDAMTPDQKYEFLKNVLGRLEVGEVSNLTSRNKGYNFEIWNAYLKAFENEAGKKPASQSAEDYCKRGFDFNESQNVNLAYSKLQENKYDLKGYPSYITPLFNHARYVTAYYVYQQLPHIIVTALSQAASDSRADLIQTRMNELVRRAYTSEDQQQFMKVDQQFAQSLNDFVALVRDSSAISSGGLIAALRGSASQGSSSGGR